MSALIITGPAASGKNTVAALLAKQRTKCAVIDVDVIRWMYLQPHKAPWDGDEGKAQQKLGVQNACLLANNFTMNAIDALVLDVITQDTAKLYRELIPEAKIVLLMPTYDEAMKRFTKRPPTINGAEFKTIYEWQEQLTDYDEKIDNTMLTVEETATKLATLI